MKHVPVNGLFIVFEGMDGVGKTTLAQRLVEELGNRAIYVHEPGGNENAERIASVFSQFSPGEIAPLTNLLLVSASRVEAVQGTIKPALEMRKFVVADRFTPSTYAYQAYGLDTPMTAVNQVVELSAGQNKPDVVFYFRVPKEDIQKVIYRANRSKPRDLGDLGYYERVYRGYEKMNNNPKAHGFTGEWVAIDATKSLDEMYSQIKEHLTHFGFISDTPTE